MAQHASAWCLNLRHLAQVASPVRPLRESAKDRKLLLHGLQGHLAQPGRDVVRKPLPTATPSKVTFAAFAAAGRELCRQSR